VFKRVLPGPTPRRKLKAFFWEPLPDNRIPGTIWETCSPLVEPIEQHQEIIETLFQVMTNVKCRVHGIMPCIQLNHSVIMCVNSMISYATYRGSSAAAL